MQLQWLALVTAVGARWWESEGKQPRAATHSSAGTQPAPPSRHTRKALLPAESAEPAALQVRGVFDYYFGVVNLTDTADRLVNDSVLTQINLNQ